MRLFVRFLIALNTRLYRMTGGRISGRLAGLSILLLETVGRKSSKRSVTPLAYFPDGANYILVASNGGNALNPQWYLNLLAQPRVHIQIGDRVLAVQARPAPAQDYDRLWQLVTRQSPMYRNYQKRTLRKIPLIVLSREPDYGYPRTNGLA